MERAMIKHAHIPSLRRRRAAAWAAVWSCVPDFPARTLLPDIDL